MSWTPQFPGDWEPEPERAVMADADFSVALLDNDGRNYVRSTDMTAVARLRFQVVPTRGDEILWDGRSFVVVRRQFGGKSLRWTDNRVLTVIVEEEQL